MKRFFGVSPKGWTGGITLVLFWGWHPSDTRLHMEPAINCPVENCKAKKIAMALQNGVVPEVHQDAQKEAQPK